MSRAQPGPRVLLVTRNFPPLVGGMERLNQRILAALAEQGAVALAGPAGCAAHAPRGACVRELPPRPLWRFLAASTWAAWRLARRLRPRLVVAGSGLAAVQAWLAARASGARLAVYVHGLDLVAPHWLYQALWLRAIRAADVVVANSRHTAARAPARGVAPARLRVVNPGVALPSPQPVDGDAVRAAHGLGPGPLLLSVGRLTERKGLEPFVREVLPALVARHPALALVVVGGDAVDALRGRAGSELARIVAAAREVGLDAHVHLPGGLDDASLQALYATADLHVFPVRDLPGDVEGFGMVALEAAAHGVATVGYAVGGVPDAVDPGRSGELVAPGDAAALAAAIERWLGKPRDAVAADCRAFARRNDWAHFGTRLREALG
ncbi:MAG: glycosyltransferase family 4 protein [Lysobacteraceae bacterium]